MVCCGCVSEEKKAGFAPGGCCVADVGEELEADTACDATSAFVGWRGSERSDNSFIEPVNPDPAGALTGLAGGGDGDFAGGTCRSLAGFTSHASSSNPPLGDCLDALGLAFLGLAGAGDSILSSAATLVG
jgi:hypothetical protein